MPFLNPLGIIRQADDSRNLWSVIRPWRRFAVRIFDFWLHAASCSRVDRLLLLNSHTVPVVYVLWLLHVPLRCEPELRSVTSWFIGSPVLACCPVLLLLLFDQGWWKPSSLGYVANVLQKGGPMWYGLATEGDVGGFFLRGPTFVTNWVLGRFFLVVKCLWRRYSYSIHAKLWNWNIEVICCSYNCYVLISLLENVKDLLMHLKNKNSGVIFFYFPWGGIFPQFDGSECHEICAFSTVLCFSTATPFPINRPRTPPQICTSHLQRVTSSETTRNF